MAHWPDVLIQPGSAFVSDSQPFQANNNGAGLGVSNAFVTAIDTTVAGQAGLVYSTFLGGSGVLLPPGFTAGDVATGIRLDSNGSIYVVGGTASTDFPVPPTSITCQPTNTGLVNAFLVELNLRAARFCSRRISAALRSTSPPASTWTAMDILTSQD